MFTTFRVTLTAAERSIRDVSITWGLHPVSRVRETEPAFGAHIEVPAVLELLDLVVTGDVTAEEVREALADLAAIAKEEQERYHASMELEEVDSLPQPEVSPRVDSRWVYVVSGEDTPKVVKIGVAADIEKRIKSLQTGSSSRIILRWSARGGLPLEGYLHEKFSSRRLSGEWFDFRRVADPVKVISEVAQTFLDEEAQTGR